MSALYTENQRHAQRGERKKEGKPLAPNEKGHEFGVRVPGVKEKKR